MLDVDSDSEINALYRLVQIKGGKRIEKFSTTDIKEALAYHSEYTKKYREGLLMEIVPEKKIYNWKEKKVSYSFE